MVKGLDRARRLSLSELGSLAGWLAAQHQTGYQGERPKNLITQSIRIFEESGQSEGVAERMLISRSVLARRIL